MMILYFDIEFRNNEKLNELVLFSWMPSDTKKPHTIDLRDGKGFTEIIKVYENHSDWTWVAYNAQADLKCLLSLGLDIRGLKVIDAMAEARMITLTHADYHSFKSGLLSSISVLGVNSALTADRKDRARELVLSKKQYTDADWQLINAYGPTDITPLPALMEAIMAIHAEMDSPITFEEMTARGEYVKAVSALSFHSAGFPVDTQKLNSIYSNRPAILHRLKESAIEQYGPVYLWNQRRNDYSWSHKGFETLIDQRGYDWEYTDTKTRLSLARDYLKEKARLYPELMPLYRIRNTCSSLSATDLRPLVKNSYIKPPIFTFSQKTGRNSPKPSMGFILNLPPYLRTVIRPEPDMLFIGADWKQQEIAIAAVLSGDDRLLDAYNNEDGDVYLALAKMAGAVPASATKSTHPLQRQTFKAVQLGLGYGKGVESLGTDVYESNRDENGSYILTMEEAKAQAEIIYDWHQLTFSTYWEWLWENIDRARFDGYIRSLDGWTYFVDDSVRDTQLLNFPMQSNGAAMLRRATIRCWETGTLDIVCPLHDALYINCRKGEQEEAIQTLQTCMASACRDILEDKVSIPVDINIYDHSSGYWDSRAKHILDEIQDLIGDSPQQL